jgi:hypothetical protein
MMTSLFLDRHKSSFASLNFYNPPRPYPRGVLLFMILSRKTGSLRGTGSNQVILLYLRQSYSFDLQPIRKFAFAERSLAANLTQQAQANLNGRIQEFSRSDASHAQGPRCRHPGGFLV